MIASVCTDKDAVKLDGNNAMLILPEPVSGQHNYRNVYGDCWLVPANSILYDKFKL